MGKIRKAILPADSTTAARVAVRHDDDLLTLGPLQEEVEMAVRIIQGLGPSHFDADLERCRNASRVSRVHLPRMSGHLKLLMGQGALMTTKTTTRRSFTDEFKGEAVSLLASVAGR